MKKDAMLLFLAETTAVAIKEGMGGEVAFASALDKRHKIRRTDLRDMYNRIAGVQKKPNSYSRFATALLLNMAAAAYDDPAAILESGDLASQPVRPHWDPSKTYTFQLVYEEEPMNLWAGWSLENKQNNNTQLDAHMLKVYQATNREDIVATAMNEDLEGDTPSSQIGASLSHGQDVNLMMTPQKPLQQGQFSASSSQPSVVLMSPFSQSLSDSSSQQMKLMSALEKTSFKATVLRKRDLRDLTHQRSEAGIQHYLQLLNSLNEVDMGKSAAYDAIQDAMQNWTSHRKKLDLAVDKLFA